MYKKALAKMVLLTVRCVRLSNLPTDSRSRKGRHTSRSAKKNLTGKKLEEGTECGAASGGRKNPSSALRGSTKDMEREGGLKHDGPPGEKGWVNKRSDSIR